MSCLPGRWRALVWLTVAAGCARPDVDDAVMPADEAGVADTGLPPDGAEDASQELPREASVEKPDGALNEPDAGLGTVDAGCADRDDDAVCDARDNCPDVANANQADADKDGVGDACSSSESDAGSACGAESVQASVQAGDAVLSAVRVNGMDSPVTVRKGERLSVSLNYAFGACSLPILGQPRFMTIGIEGQSMGDCRILLEVPCPAEVSAMTTLNVDVPNKTGPVYIVALGRQGFACSNSLSNSKRIAALCVE